MHRHQRVGEDLAGGFGPRLHQILDVEPDLLAAERAVGLVADLHHADLHARVPEPCEAVTGVVVHGLGLLLDLHVLPLQRDHLLAGIGPEVGVVEVHDQGQARRGRASADGDGRLDVAVAAAEAVSVRVKGVVPHAHADVRDAVFREDLKQVPLRAVEIVIAHAAGFLGDDGGDVHAEDEVLRQILHGLDIEFAPVPVRSRKSRAEQEQNTQNKDQTQHLFHRCPPCFHCRGGYEPPSFSCSMSVGG